MVNKTHVPVYVSQHEYSAVMKNLRSDIVLCSLYLSDYQNRYELPPKDICLFFDGFCDFIEERMMENVTGYSDDLFFKLLPQYDTLENLLAWLDCCEWHVGGVSLQQFFEEKYISAVA